jgi:Protein of unknown function (DUF3054)
VDIKEKIIDTVTTDTKPKTLSNAQRITLLVIGDALVFLIFAAIGRRSHGEAVGLDAILQIVQTAAPFAIAWFIVSPFLGAYRRQLESQPRRMALRTLLAWLVAWPLSMIFRGVFVDHAVPPWTFALITLVTNTILLLLWRWPLALFNNWRKR